MKMLIPIHPGNTTHIQQCSSTLCIIKDYISITATCIVPVAFRFAYAVVNVYFINSLFNIRHFNVVPYLCLISHLIHEHLIKCLITQPPTSSVRKHRCAALPSAPFNDTRVLVTHRQLSIRR